MVALIEPKSSFEIPALDVRAINELKASLQGQLILPEDGAYDVARKLWNAQVDKRPALIARVANPGDVVSAVRFARRHGLRLSVRGGGHNPSGSAIAEGGLVIDLSKMRKIEVDPENRVARAEGGATWGELDRATQEYGLAATGTDISTVGIGGSTLGGGQGWLGRAIGLAIDNLVSAELVTADGRFLHVSESE
ncbi:MAG: FAD-dependent oxidoreductase, partial [Chloroflexi bacterium]|nr:FAD-dependent oxidoreductase [Chloroflexota bacterium]